MSKPPAPQPRGGRFTWIALGFILGAAMAMSVYAQSQPTQQAQAPVTRMFTSDAGMVLNFVKADKTADFEAVMSKLKEALQKSEKRDRKQQAVSWKIFKSPEPAVGGSVLYVFVIDPTVKGADYTVSNILAEAFPTDQVNSIYKQYAEAYASGQNFVNLSLFADLSK
jgi:hypothetical protein